MIVIQYYHLVICVQMFKESLMSETSKTEENNNKKSSVDTVKYYYLYILFNGSHFREFFENDR